MMRFSAFLLLVLSLPAFAADPAPAASDAKYQVQDPVLIKTRDGADISAIVVRKQGATQPLPVVLFFTTYYEGPEDADFAKEAADHGYVGIVAYTRGIRTDLKQYTPYIHDGDDADDVIAWIAKQPWCDGQVGMFGGSYTGFVQWSAARHAPAALKTIVPQVAVMPGFDFPMENNVHVSFSLGWASSLLGFPRLPDDLNDKWYQQGAAFADQDKLAGQPNRIFQTWLQHPAYDAYWRSLVPTPEQYAALHMPILVTDGYYDGAQIAETRYIKDYLKYNPHPDLYLVIGPYDHFGAQRAHPEAELSGYRIDPSAANVSMRGLVYEWFDYVLKGGKKPALLKDRVNYEVMGADEWRHAPDLKRMHERELTFYLSAGQGSDHLLDPKHQSKEGSLTQTVDFADRKTQNNYFTPFILLDELDPSNGLVFETAPFDHDFSIDGAFAGNLSAALDKQDMDVSIAFYQKMPDGKYFYLTRYLGRASYAKDRTQRQLLKPGVKTAIPLNETSMTSRKIVKGSRLVIVLNVNKHPYDEINYGTGGDVSHETVKDAGKPLHVQWFNDSYITVPVQDE